MNSKALRRELADKQQEVEQHAYSVRQLQERRNRTEAALHLMAQQANNIGPTGLRDIITCLETTPSEFYQDAFCLILNGGKRDGFFVEFGACDGKLISNTLTLEALGWRGILAEPLPKWHQDLKHNRSCAIDTRCVWSRSGERVHLSEIADDRYATQASVVPGERATSVTHEVETVSLDDMLREHNAPRLIDFMSVDAEGAEFEILNAFSFKYRAGFLAVEMLHAATADQNALERLLETNGYERILHDRSGYDGYFISVERDAELKRNNKAIDSNARFDRAHREIIELVGNDPRIMIPWNQEQARRRRQAGSIR